MGRIDDALTRVTGKPGTAPKSSFFKRFASERRTGRRGALPGEDRHYPSVSAAARREIEARFGPIAPAKPPARLTQDTDPTDGVFALRQIGRYASFGAHAVLRHKRLVVVTFIVTFALILAGAKYVPRTYEIEVKLLAQRSDVISSLTNPGRSIPYDADAPTRAAAEMILRRDNVISLIRQTDLLNEWDRTRAPVLKLFDRWKAKLVGHEPTLDEKLDDLIAQIEQRMAVSTTSDRDGLVTIYLQWPDAASGYHLVERAQQAFLQARQVAETQSIAEALTLLDRYAANLRKELQDTLEELGRTRARVLSQLGSRPRRYVPSQPQSIVASILDSPNPADEPIVPDDPAVDLGVFSDPRLTRLKRDITAKRRELDRLEEDQKRKLSELQAQLNVARAIYTPNHPTIQSLQQSVGAFLSNSPQITMLRRQIDRLETESDEQAAAAAERVIRADLGQQTSRPAPRPAQPRSVMLAPLPQPEPDPTDLPDGSPRPDAVADFATLRLRTELNHLHSILERYDAARIELAVSQAAFKHRYAIISPASEPSEPLFPETKRVLLTGLIGSLVFALFAAIAADILSNRILEPWQVQRQLGLPLLGTARTS